jgi:hypothetical protein
LAGVIVSEEKMVAGVVDSGKQPKILNILTKIVKKLKRRELIVRNHRRKPIQN